MRMIIYVLMPFVFLGSLCSVANSSENKGAVQIRYEDDKDKFRLVNLDSTESKSNPEYKITSEYKYAEYFYFPSVTVVLSGEYQGDEVMRVIRVMKNNTKYRLITEYLENVDRTILYYKNKEMDVFIYYGDDYYGGNVAVFLLNKKGDFVELGNFFISTEDREEPTYQKVVFNVFKEGNFLHIQSNKNENASYFIGTKE